MFQSICCQYLENGEFSNGRPTSALCSNRYRKQSTVVIEKLHTYARFIYKTTGTPNLQISVTLILAYNVWHRTHYGVNESNQIQQISLNISAFGDANLSITFQVIFAKWCSPICYRSCGWTWCLIEWKPIHDKSSPVVAAPIVCRPYQALRNNDFSRFLYQINRSVCKNNNLSTKFRFLDPCLKLIKLYQISFYCKNVYIFLPINYIVLILHSIHSN